MEPISDLSPTKRALLAKMLQERARAKQPASIAKVDRTGRDAFELSYAQRRLWFIDRLHPSDPLYVIPYIIEFKGELDPGVLGRALAEIVRRHEVLRTVFRVEDGVPSQVVLP